MLILFFYRCHHFMTIFSNAFNYGHYIIGYSKRSNNNCIFPTFLLLYLKYLELLFICIFFIFLLLLFGKAIYTRAISPSSLHCEIFEFFSFSNDIILKFILFSLVVLISFITRNAFVFSSILFGRYSKCSS